jgi:hypothetical protein
MKSTCDSCKQESVTEIRATYGQFCPKCIEAEVEMTAIEQIKLYPSGQELRVVVEGYFIDDGFSPITTNSLKAMVTTLEKVKMRLEAADARLSLMSAEDDNIRLREYVTHSLQAIYNLWSLFPDSDL